MKGKWMSVMIAVVLVFVALFVLPVFRAYAAPPQPADCATQAYNLIAGKNCGVEATVPDTNWEVSNAVITIERSTDQVHNGSYAMKITGTAATSNNTSVGAQTIKTSNPVAVTGGTNYSFVSWIYIPSTATRVSAARLRAAWYVNADCSGSQLSTNTVDVTTTDTWTYGWLSVTAPATATCAQLRLFIQTPASGSGVNPVGPVYFDNVMFYPSTATALTLRAMDARTAGGGAALPLLALTLAGGVAAAGARVAGRRR